MTLKASPAWIEVTETTAARAGTLGTPLVYGGHTPCTEVSHGDQTFFVDMGKENEAVCGYCATLFRYRPDLHADETVPPGQLYTEAASAV